MLTQSEDVVKQMNFYVDTPIGTVFNQVEELGDIANIDLNTYNKNKYTNSSYNIINKNWKCKIGLWKWNRKDIADKTLDAFKPHFCTTHQEL